MKFEENVPLAEYTTMRVGGPARYLTHIKNKEELVEAVEFAKEKDLEIMIIGGGANTVFSDQGYGGLVIINEIKGVEVSEDGQGVLVKAGSGEIWDDVVKKSVELDLTGIEAMTMVPGTVGAAPVHNIGCYGQELSETFVVLEAYDRKEEKFVELTKEDCGFGYRTSVLRFDHPKSEEGRYIVVSVTMKLKKGSMEAPFYKDLEAYFKENNISDFSPTNVRRALIHIRTNKLPDPKEVANSGSFFRNPVVSKEKFNQIEKKEPSINDSPEGWPQPPRWFLPDGSVKIAAGWLVEQAGYSSHSDEETGMATWPTQNLTIVNKKAKSAGDVIKFKDDIKRKVKNKFGIDLEEEVRVIE